MAEELNDLDALDRELSELLAVEPSPDFAAKVRTRIEREPEPALGWWYWAGAAAAAAVVIAVAFGTLAPRTPAVQAPLTASRDVHLPPQVDRVAPTPVAATPSRHVARARRAETLARAPEVLVDPTLAAAVRRLTTQQRVLPEVPREPSLDPVVIEPLKVSELSDVTKQGDRQ